MKVKSESEVTQSCPTLRTPWTAANQAPPSMGFSRQEYWSGLPLPSPHFLLIVLKSAFDVNLRSALWMENHGVEQTPPYPVLCVPMFSKLLGLGPKCRASQVALVIKNPSASAGDGRDADWIPGSGRSPGEGHGNPPQYSCLENPLGRKAWWAIVHGAAKTWTRLKWLSTHTTQGQRAVPYSGMCDARSPHVISGKWGSSDF